VGLLRAQGLHFHQLTKITLPGSSGAAGTALGVRHMQFEMGGANYTSGRLDQPATLVALVE
jgi:hypothetical protein